MGSSLLLDCPRYRTAALLAVVYWVRASSNRGALLSKLTSLPPIHMLLDPTAGAMQWSSKSYLLELSRPYLVKGCHNVPILRELQRLIALRLIPHESVRLGPRVTSWGRSTSLSNGYTDFYKVSCAFNASAKRSVHLFYKYFGQVLDEAQNGYTAACVCGTLWLTDGILYDFPRVPHKNTHARWLRYFFRDFPSKKFHGGSSGETKQKYFSGPGVKFSLAAFLVPWLWQYVVDDRLPSRWSKHSTGISILKIWRVSFVSCYISWILLEWCSLSSTLRRIWKSALTLPLRQWSIMDYLHAFDDLTGGWVPVTYNSQKVAWQLEYDQGVPSLPPTFTGEACNCFLISNQRALLTRPDDISLPGRGRVSSVSPLWVDYWSQQLARFRAFVCSKSRRLKHPPPMYKESFGYKLLSKERTLLSCCPFSPLVHCNFVGEADIAFKRGQLQRCKVFTSRRKAGLDGKVAGFIMSWIEDEKVEAEEAYESFLDKLCFEISTELRRPLSKEALLVVKEWSDFRVPCKILMSGEAPKEEVHPDNGHDRYHPRRSGLLEICEPQEGVGTSTRRGRAEYEGKEVSPPRPKKKARRGALSVEEWLGLEER
ncbi:hypothetical protein Acr_17g0006060 [Actinidia rufa]|uniref:Aminotransferase-like plant mobile domain-containing protein n=1 Tax=Actinidia rufa TaxID=165716 RepID=A0A7J0G2M0_9ERIC|nr:hypothetical protein Acr_17g0006060 [Actinidia rufa]